MLAILVLIGFLALVVLGMPVFAAMGLSALAGALAGGLTDALARSMALSISQAFSEFVLVAVPLYILVGTLMEQAGFSRRLFEFAKCWVGRVNGGLGVATVAACALFAAISGSSVATVATIGLVSFPALTESGYKRDFSGALIAAGGTLGILIPPSIAMILYGVIAEQSIGKLFIAGIVPGIVLASAMAIYTALTVRGTQSVPKFSFAEKIEATRRATWVLMLPVIVLGTIYTGLATPTEAAAIALVYVVALGLLTRSLDRGKLVIATKRAAATTVMIFMLLGFGRYMTEFFTLSGLPEAMVTVVSQLGLGKVAVTGLMIGLFLVLGTILEAISMMLVAVPILFPITQKVGIDPLAFGVFVVLAIEAAQITPPIGINIFTIASIGKVDIRHISLHMLPFIAMIVAMMLAVVFFEGLATWLPGTM